MKPPERIFPGDTFGLLTVIDFVGRNAGYQAIFKVECTCGSRTEVLGTNLKRGNTTRCNSGVHRNDHGMVNTVEYAAWKAMKWRCSPKNKPNRKYYFDRGIAVCEEWVKSFTAFRAHVGAMPAEGMEIDRLVGSRGYEPGNVRWATRRQQMQNTARALKIEIDGQTRCASEWSRLSGISMGTLLYRIRRGWPNSELLSIHRWKHRVGRCA